MLKPSHIVMLKHVKSNSNNSLMINYMSDRDETNVYCTDKNDFFNAYMLQIVDLIYCCVHSSIFYVVVY